MFSMFYVSVSFKYPAVTANVLLSELLHNISYPKLPLYVSIILCCSVIIIVIFNQCQSDGRCVQCQIKSLKIIP